MAFPSGPLKETSSLIKRMATAAGRRGAPISELASRLGLEPGRAKYIRDIAVREKLIRKVGNGRGTRYVRAST